MDAENMNTDPPDIATGTASTSTGAIKKTTLQQKERAKKSPQNYDYRAEDPAPYRVYIEIDKDKQEKEKQEKEKQDKEKQDKEKSQSIVRSINRIGVGRMLKRIFSTEQCLTEIKIAGKTKVVAYFNSHIAANRVIRSEYPGSQGYKCYIPRHLVSVTGVITDIPVDVTDDEIKQELYCPVPIMNIYRLNRFVNNAAVPLTTVSITFRTNTLPPTVKLYACAMKVKPYVRRAILCLNCLRYNHKTGDCRSSRRCVRCGTQHSNDTEFDQCNLAVKCVYCKTDHGTDDTSCPERNRQNAIKTAMAKNGLTYGEAREKFSVGTSNRFDALSSFADEPTPAISFANALKRNTEPKPSHTIRRRPASPQATQETRETYRKRPKSTCDTEATGTALNNSHKVSESDKWKNKLEEIEKRNKITTETTINRAVQDAITRYYTKILEECSLKGKPRDNFIEISKQFISFDSIHSNQSQ